MGRCQRSERQQAGGEMALNHGRLRTVRGTGKTTALHGANTSGVSMSADVTSMSALTGSLPSVARLQPELAGVGGVGREDQHGRRGVVRGVHRRTRDQAQQVLAGAGVGRLRGPLGERRADDLRWRAPWPAGPWSSR